jgi:hypothetical protein
VGYDAEKEAGISVSLINNKRQSHKFGPAFIVKLPIYCGRSFFKVTGISKNSV